MAALRACLAALFAASLLAGCAPSKFDGLTGGRVREQDDPNLAGDAESTAGELDADREPSDAEPEHEAEPDAPEGMDAGDANAAAPPGGPSDAGQDARVLDAEAGGALCARNSTTFGAAAMAIELVRLKPPASVATRTAGPSVQLATTRIWTFESLRLSSTIADVRPAARPGNYPSSARDGTSTPWTPSAPTSVWELSEHLDAQGLPISHIPLLTAEQPNGEFLTLMIASLVRDPNQANVALGFVKKASGWQPFSESWLVTVSSGGNMATRGSAPVFQAPDPIFGHTLVRHGDYFKAFACPGTAAGTPAESAHPCLVARVPLARLGERAAYEFYARDAAGNGAWTSDVARAVAVVQATEFAVSVSFNDYLQRFLLVYGEPSSNDVALRVAPAPEGPWSERVRVRQAPGRYWPHFNAREQPSLAQNCGKRVIITSWLPLDGMSLPDGGAVFPTTGDVVLSAIDLE
ncbi:MAG TPA: DUF4185 domain-containing protein [Polyangiaceae bacterium]|nr:DUF4185 domain-containing protein [Polyangiaceae bacterium]